jgi:hypothetical protein
MKAASLLPMKPVMFIVQLVLQLLRIAGLLMRHLFSILDQLTLISYEHALSPNWAYR